MNREQGDAPLAAGVDGGRMFWTVSGDSPPHGFPFPNLSTGPPSSLSHPLQEFTWLTGPWALQPPLSGLWTSSRSWEAGPWPGLQLLTPRVSLKHHWLGGDFT